MWILHPEGVQSILEALQTKASARLQKVHGRLKCGGAFPVPPCCVSRGNAAVPAGFVFWKRKDTAAGLQDVCYSSTDDKAI